MTDLQCDDARDRAVAALVQRRTLDSEVSAHCERCSACASEVAALTEAWNAVGRHDVGVSAVDKRMAARAVAAQLRIERNSRRRAPVSLMAAVFAALMVGGVGGWLLGSRPVAVPVATHVLLLRGEGVTSASEVAASVEEHRRWAGSIARDGKLVAAEKLQLTDISEFGSVTPIISGFFLIRANDEADARRIALTTPHLREGGGVQLIRIETTEPQ